MYGNVQWKSQCEGKAASMVKKQEEELRWVFLLGAPSLEITVGKGISYQQLE
jgi:hypothetical protein